MTFPLKLHLLKKEKSLKSIKGTIHTICIWREESWKNYASRGKLGKTWAWKKLIINQVFRNVFFSLKKFL